ncbi:MAG: sulfatase [Rhodopirellula sp.]|nr:sulfatase [Rhodopirellula sp.]
MRNILTATNRRAFLQQSACSFGSLALQQLLHQQHLKATDSTAPSQLSAASPHFKPRAKRIIFLYMKGGPSQMDLFDYKPQLASGDGKGLPYKLPSNEETVGLDDTKLMAPISPFARRGESGLHISKWFEHLGRHADDICVLKAMHSDSPNHGVAERQLHTGNLFDVTPSMGAWLSYGLGNENDQLPAYITILPGEGERNYSSAFLPAIHQGTAIQEVGITAGRAPIRHLTDRSVSQDIQRQRVDLIKALNQEQLKRLDSDQEMEGVIQSFELAFRMQSQTPKLVDLANESKATKDLYGVDMPETNQFGRQCLLARRFAEAGVRFIQVTLNGWDHHNNIRSGLPKLVKQCDHPVAGLLTDLKQRGLLDDTLVLWGGEFGRTPHAQFGDGREHNPHGYAMWMAGGGVRGGMTHGTTDDFAYHAVEDSVHINDLHATLLHLMGIDHEKLTYEHHGRPFRLTDVAGRVVHEILS